MTNDYGQKTVASQVEQMIRQYIDSDVSLTEETDLLNDLAIDSLELVEIGLGIGKSFEVRLPMAEVRRCVTLGELTQLVEHTVEEKPGKPA